MQRITKIHFIYLLLVTKFRIYFKFLLIYFQRDVTSHSLFISGKLLYVFRVVSSPIIRSTYNCIYSIWYGPLNVKFISNVYPKIYRQTIYESEGNIINRILYYKVCFYLHSLIFNLLILVSLFIPQTPEFLDVLQSDQEGDYFFSFSDYRDVSHFVPCTPLKFS